MHWLNAHDPNWSPPPLAIRGMQSTTAVRLGYGGYVTQWVPRILWAITDLQLWSRFCWIFSWRWQNSGLVWFVPPHHTVTETITCKCFRFNLTGEMAPFQNDAWTSLCWGDCQRTPPAAQIRLKETCALAMNCGSDWCCSLTLLSAATKLSSRSALQQAGYKLVPVPPATPASSQTVIIAPIYHVLPAEFLVGLHGSGGLQQPACGSSNA